MCGIAGIWNAATNEVARSAVAAMVAALRHRGPDGSGMAEFEGGALGAVRLALIDPTRRGQQPLWSADRTTAILFNGEMYNYRRERTLLEQEGYPFRSATDTEVVLALYLRHGLDFVQRIRGMYALAIFDWRSRKAGGQPDLVLARDPFGIKPLYLWQGRGHPGPLLFASEIRALLASGLVPARIEGRG
jgi:asparagine synthase (glutamine-hydrolysing)